MWSGNVKKSFVSVVVVALVLAVILAGCSKANDAPSNSAASSAPASTTTPEASKAAEPEKKENITVSVYERGNIPPEEGTAIKNRWTDWLNENGPANVEYVAIPRNGESEKFNTLFASGSAPDLIFTWTNAVMNNLIAQKQLLPIDDLIDNYSTEYKQLLEKYPGLRRMGMKSDGKTYGLGMAYPFDVNQMLFVRADWLKKLNLQVPTTTEEWFEVLKAFADNDPDGNGQKDTFGINLSFVGGQVVQQSFGMLGYYNVTPDGQFVRHLEREAAAAAFMKQLYDANIVDKDYLTDQDGSKAMQDFVNGKLGMYGAAGITGGKNAFETLKANVPDAEVMAIPLPRSEFGQFSPAVSSPLYITAAINANAKNPQAVMKYVDFLVKESTARTLSFGLEGTHYQVADNGCPQAIDADKNAKELSWAVDLNMLGFVVLQGKCADFVTTLDTSNSLQMEYAKIVQQAREAYLSPERPIYYDVDYASMPDLPQDLQMARSNALQAIFDVYAKAVVGGSSYTAEQAAIDAKAAWERAGGKELDDFYAKWFAENKDNIVYTKDYYDMKL